MTELSGAAIERLARTLDEHLAVVAAPGAILAVTDRDETLGVLARGTADVAAGTPMGTDTRSLIGSISKSFAAIVAMQEIEAGRLDLHAPVTSYVPWFEVGGAVGPITAHHLLSHTSGLPIGMETADDAAPAVWLLREVEVGFAPGERFWYSNDGYKLLGLILERITGRSIRDLLRERILEPLGMSRTDPAMGPETRLDLATGHVPAFDDRAWEPGHPLVVANWTHSTTADGSIASTAADMAAYARLLLNRGKGSNGRVLSEEGYRTMTTPVIEAEEEGSLYGYGVTMWKEDGRARIGHSGGMVGFTAQLWLAPGEGLGAVALLNGTGTKQLRERVCEFAVAVAAAERAGEPTPDPPARDAARGPRRSPLGADDLRAAQGFPEALRPFVGTYRSHNPWDPILRIVPRWGGLVAASVDEEDRRLEEIRPGVFRIGPAWSPDRVRFEAVVDGRAQIAVRDGARLFRSFLG